MALFQICIPYEAAGTELLTELPWQVKIIDGMTTVETKIKDHLL